MTNYMLWTMFYMVVSMISFVCLIYLRPADTSILISTFLLGVVSIIFGVMNLHFFMLGGDSPFIHLLIALSWLGQEITRIFMTYFQ